MSTKDAQTLRQISTMDVTAGDAQTLQRVAAQLDSDAERYADSEKLQAIGKSAFDSIAEMVAALECDYDRLDALREERDDWAEDDDLPEPRVKHWSDAYPDESAELADLESEAGDCTDREDAERRIHEDPLSIEMRGDWYGYGTEPADAGRPVEFNILLGTGGPATRIIGELDEHGEPSRARLQVQDWFLPWTDYVGGDSETLLTYCRCFYFGEG